MCSVSFPLIFIVDLLSLYGIFNHSTATKKSLFGIRILYFSRLTMTVLLLVFTSIIWSQRSDAGDFVSVSISYIRILNIVFSGPIKKELILHIFTSLRIELYSNA